VNSAAAILKFRDVAIYAPCACAILRKEETDLVRSQSQKFTHLVNGVRAGGGSFFPYD
jgi:hypothetical protein